MGNNASLFASVAHRIVVDCLAIRPGERVLVATDTRSDTRLVDAISTLLIARDSESALLEVPWQRPHPHDYPAVGFGDPPTFLRQAYAAADVVIGYSSTVWYLSPAARAGAARGTRFLWLPGDFDFLRPLILQEDLDELARLGKAVTDRLTGARRLEFRAANGTDLRAKLAPDRRAVYDDQRAVNPGEIDYFPSGLWGIAPVEDSVEGTVVFDVSLQPVGLLESPVLVRFEQGRVVDVEGGRQAREWRDCLDSLGQPDIYRISHMSGGLAKTARISHHDWEAQIIRGSVMVAVGENIAFGGANTVQAHFDGTLLNADVLVDGEPIAVAGRYLLSAR